MTKRFFPRTMAVAGTMVLAGFLALASAAPALALSARDPSPTFTVTSPIINGVPEGPVGTYVSISAASGWTPNATIVISVTPSSSSCSSGQTPIPAQKTSPGTITVAQDGSFTATFQWPADANSPGPYAICANEENGGTQVGSGQQNFIVLSAGNGQASSPPTASVTTASATVHNGDQITVTGTNWLPAQQVSLLLQFAGQTLSSDPGDLLQQVTSGPDGTFNQQITLNTSRQGSLWILAVGSQKTGNAQYPYSLMATSQPFTIGAAPSPTATPSPVPPTATATTVGAGGGSSTNNNSGSQGPLILLLGLIAVVLLVAGVVVAVLALRGRAPGGPAPSGGWGPSGPNAPGWGGNYAPGAPWDETQVGGPPSWGSGGNVASWDDNWQGPSGQPWSGRISRAPGGPLPPTPSRPFSDDAEDDPYRTRMGDPPYQPPAPPYGPPPSSPAPGSQTWGDDPNDGPPTSPWAPQR
jgi:hypothetical protein